MNLTEADKFAQELWNLDVIPWDRYWVPIFRKFARDLVLNANLKPAQLILDIGTGTGIAAFEAAKRIRRGFVIGIDRSQQMINLARKNSVKMKLENVFFIEMNAEQTVFPDGLFDRVLSNCGISYATLPQTSREVLRVLHKGGQFTLNDWRLIDVPAHREFSEILRKHRTRHPSRKLCRWREAASTLESFGNQYLDLKKEALLLEEAGFEKVRISTKKYRVLLPSIQTYLNMRLDRIALKQELVELSPNRRTEFITDLRRSLRRHVRNGRFTINWKLNFIQAEKPMRR